MIKLLPITADFFYLRMTEDWYTVDANSFLDEEDKIKAIGWCTTLKTQVILCIAMQLYYESCAEGKPNPIVLYSDIFTAWFEDKNDAARFRLIWG